MEVRFGAESPDLHVQLGIFGDKVELVAKTHRRGNTCVIVIRMLTDGETRKARKRIMKEINEIIDSEGKES